MPNPTSTSSDNRRPKVSLEELLHFKRAERPDDAFWDKFDGELHQRMMQTLVKKDPWPIQVLRGLSGRIAQTTAVVGLAAFIAVMIIRPALLTTVEQTQPAFAEANEGASAQVDPSVDELDPALLANADYATESLSVPGDGDAAITSEYGLDHILVVNYEKEAYSADTSLPGFASAGVASIVY